MQRLAPAFAVVGAVVAALGASGNEPLTFTRVISGAWALAILVVSALAVIVATSADRPRIAIAGYATLASL